MSITILNWAPRQSGTLHGHLSPRLANRSRFTAQVLDALRAAQPELFAAEVVA